jgi:predicted XRE-type DNA-binding protein
LSELVEVTVKVHPDRVHRVLSFASTMQKADGRNSRFPPEVIEEMQRAYWGRELSQKQIAEKYAVSQGWVSKMISTGNTNQRNKK